MNSTTTQPSASAFAEAMQHPSYSITHAGLSGLTNYADLRGFPESVSGQSAIVFRVATPTGDRALRCFTADPLRSRTRYVALRGFREQHNPTWMPAAEWHDQAIRVDGGSYPVVVMDWVTGENLDVHLKRLVSAGEVNRIGALADKWRQMIAEMATLGFAHGDLQHGNVIVNENEELRLVDFDSVWMASVSSEPPGESGHPHYQHPTRVREGSWGPQVDSFSALVIYTSLRAVAARPALWKHNTGDNLIFQSMDFHAPFRTPLWQELASIKDPDFQTAATALTRVCSASQPPELGLDHLIPAAAPGWWAQAPLATGSTSPSTLPPPNSPSSTTDASHWEQTSALPWAMTPARASEPSSPDPNPQPWQAPGATDSATVAASASTVAAWEAMTRPAPVPATSSKKSWVPWFLAACVVGVFLALVLSK